MSVPITVSEHGGRSRHMLTLEVGRKSVDRITLYSVDEVMQLVRRWLLEQQQKIEHES